MKFENRKITNMKKTIIVLTAAVAFACNSATDKSASTESAAKTETTAPAADSEVPPGLTREEYDKAVQLIATSDCLTCHKVEEKVTGPAYKDVAKKYEATDANIEMLAGKVVKGGTGVWGQVPMTPHDSLSMEM
jgi:cytochrome c